MLRLAGFGPETAWREATARLREMTLCSPAECDVAAFAGSDPLDAAAIEALLQSGKYAEAESVFRTDLERLPGNGWSLFGLGRALRLQGKDAEAATFEARFAEAWKNADVEITSPCFCQRGV